MFRFLLLSIVTSSLFFSSCKGKPKVSPEQSTAQSTESFDEKLAQQLGADDYGMSQYVMAFLKAGPNRPTDPKRAEELQAAHMDNIQRMAEEGKLVLAGPFLGDGELRGIYIFDVKTVEEAEALTNTDPAIKEGSLVMELHPWYGSAAVKQISTIHDQISKIKM